MFLPEGGEGLSVVMMGRDEEHHLRESLPPLLAVADEVVFVDTGSRDGSLGLLRAAGVRVFEVAWEGDFSGPKNSGITQARYSWILNVDCDEILQDVPRVGSVIRSLCRQGSLPGYRVFIDNLMVDGQVSESQAIRLFRNHPDIRFTNPVHESVARSLSLHWPQVAIPEAAGVRLLHLGYRGGENREKIRRNIAILRAWLAREPGNLFGCYKLGINLRHVGSVSEGLFFLQRGFELLDQEPNRSVWPFAEKLVGEYYRALLEDGHRGKAVEVRKRVEGWE